MRSARALVLLVSAAVALATASLAGAEIELQKGIAGVRLQMSQTKVRAVLGKPTSTKRASNEFGPYIEFRYPALRVTFQGNGGVTNVSTTRASEQTPGGIGVGSTEAALKRALRGETCKTEFGVRHCWLGKFLPGKRVTDFRIRKGRVDRVDIGFVID